MSTTPPTALTRRRIVPAAHTLLAVHPANETLRPSPTGALAEGALPTTDATSAAPAAVDQPRASATTTTYVLWRRKEARPKEEATKPSTPSAPKLAAPARGARATRPARKQKPIASAPKARAPRPLPAGNGDVETAFRRAASACIVEHGSARTREMLADVEARMRAALMR